MPRTWIIFYKLVFLVVVYMDNKKYKYSEYLEISETFNDWLKKVPFGFWVRGIKVNKDRSVTFIFKNSLDSERWIEE
tara:strand:- start:264 stop:494 length:231 start_codon:yes stop_codon:yes gene_type:complete